ncbi:hypothetical protein JTE90_029337 [Oedothorax gibbosus]|uniref:Uncharacterized protein n=1 Tax=Oedothorax gibbosus TaxID=931172 RepID=A0AAV6UHB5_9ARAC|nr:hypothetical protein JTE90_029337 [Oedothorax gibbosus]
MKPQFPFNIKTITDSTTSEPHDSVSPPRNIYGDTVDSPPTEERLRKNFRTENNKEQVTENRRKSGLEVQFDIHQRALSF